MVLVDTSVWISLFRKDATDLARRVSWLVNENEAAICGPVWVEFIGGFRSKTRRRQYQSNFEAYPWLDVTEEVFRLAANWTAERRGIGAIDAVIAATARIHGAGLLTTDRAFTQFVHEGVAVEYFG